MPAQAKRRVHTRPFDGVFSAPRTDLSRLFCRIWGGITNTRMTAALAIGGWRQGSLTPLGQSPRPRSNLGQLEGDGALSAFHDSVPSKKPGGVIERVPKHVRIAFSTVNLAHQNRQSGVYSTRWKTAVPRAAVDPGSATFVVARRANSQVFLFSASSFWRARSSAASIARPIPLPAFTT